MSEFKFGIIAIVIILLLAFIISIPFETNDHSYNVTVTDKERVNSGKSSKYLIFCQKEDGSEIVFQNTDTFIKGKFDSSDFYAKIKIGEKYKFTVVGYRNSFFSWYENIIKIEKIE